MITPALERAAIQQMLQRIGQRDLPGLQNLRAAYGEETPHQPVPQTANHSTVIPQPL